MHAVKYGWVKHFKDKRAKAILHGFIELVTNLHVDQIN